MFRQRHIRIWENVGNKTVAFLNTNLKPAPWQDDFQALMKFTGITSAEAPNLITLASAITWENTFRF